MSDDNTLENAWTSAREYDDWLVKMARVADAEFPDSPQVDHFLALAHRLNDAADRTTMAVALAYAAIADALGGRER